MATDLPEKGKEVAPSIGGAPLVVQQPQKLESLLETIDLIDSFSEKIGEGPGEMGPAGAGPAAAGAGAQPQASWRDQAIASLPESKVMQKHIEKHLQKEVKKLNREVRRISRFSKPGSAHKLNELYAHIRRLNGLFTEILEASFEVLKRLYIRIVIDKQSVI